MDGLKVEISFLKEQQVEMKSVHQKEMDVVVDEKKALEEHLATSRYQNTSLRDQVSDLRDQLQEAGKLKQDTSDEILALCNELKHLRDQDNDEVIQLRSKVQSLENNLSVCNETLTNERQLHSGQNT